MAKLNHTLLAALTSERHGTGNGLQGPRRRESLWIIAQPRQEPCSCQGAISPRKGVPPGCLGMSFKQSVQFFGQAITLLVQVEKERNKQQQRSDINPIYFGALDGFSQGYIDLGTVSGRSVAQ